MPEHTPPKTRLPRLRTPTTSAPPRPDPTALLLGRRLQSFRLQARLSQRDLGREAGLSQAAISMIENGHRRPEFTALTRMARLLGADLAALVADTDYLEVLETVIGPLPVPPSTPDHPGR